MAAQKRVYDDGTFVYDIDVMCKRIDEYIAATKDKGIPILAECMLVNGWSKQRVMDLQRQNPKLKRYIEKLLMWKEVKLEQGALSGQYDKTAAIFSLKQLGWTDKQEIKTDEVVRIIDDV